MKNKNQKKIGIFILMNSMNIDRINNKAYMATNTIIQNKKSLRQMKSNNYK